MPFLLADYEHIPTIFYAISSLEASKAFLTILDQDELTYLFFKSVPLDQKRYPSWLHYECDPLINKGSADRVQLILDTIKNHSSNPSCSLDYIISLQASPSGRTLLHEILFGFPEQSSQLVSTVMSMISNNVARTLANIADASGVTGLHAAACQLLPITFQEFLQKLDTNTLGAAILQYGSSRQIDFSEEANGLQAVLQWQNSENICSVLKRVSPFKAVAANKNSKAIDGFLEDNLFLYKSKTDAEKIKKIYSQIYKSVTNPKHEIEKRPQEFVQFAAHYIKSASDMDVPDQEAWMSLLEKAIQACKPNDHKTKDQLHALLARVSLNLYTSSKFVSNTLLVKACQSLYAISGPNFLDAQDNLFVGTELISILEIGQLKEKTNEQVLAVSMADNIYATYEMGLKHLKAASETKVLSGVLPLIEPALQSKAETDTHTVNLLSQTIAKCDVKDEKYEQPVMVHENDHAKMAIKLLAKHVSKDAKIACDPEARDQLFNAKVKETDRQYAPLYNMQWRKLSEQIIALYKIVKPGTVEFDLLLSFARYKIEYEVADESVRTHFLPKMREIMRREVSGFKKTFFASPYQKCIEATQSILVGMISNANQPSLVM